MRWLITWNRVLWKGFVLWKSRPWKMGFFFFKFFFKGIKMINDGMVVSRSSSCFCKLILEDVIINFNWLVFLGLGIDKVHMWGQREEGVWLIDACGHGEHGCWFVKEKRRPWIYSWGGPLRALSMNLSRLIWSRWFSYIWCMMMYWGINFCWRLIGIGGPIICEFMSLVLLRLFQLVDGIWL